MFSHYDAKGGDGMTGVVAIYVASGVQVEVPAQPAAKTAELAAAITAINAALAGKTLQQYAVAHIAQKRIIYSAVHTFAEGFRLATDPPTLAEYRTALGDTLAVILTLPNGFVTELTRERFALGLPDAPVSAWTLAQCQGWHQLLSGWLARLLGSLTAAMVEGLD